METQLLDKLRHRGTLCFPIMAWCQTWPTQHNHNSLHRVDADADDAQCSQFTNFCVAMATTYLDSGVQPLPSTS